MKAIDGYGASGNRYTQLNKTCMQCSNKMHQCGPNRLQCRDNGLGKCRKHNSDVVQNRLLEIKRYFDNRRHLIPNKKKLLENVASILVFVIFISTSVGVSVIYANEPGQTPASDPFPQAQNDGAEDISIVGDRAVEDEEAQLRQQASDEFVNNLKHELRVYQKDLLDVSNNVVEAEDRLTQVHAMAATLKEQLAHLESQIENSTQMITNVAVQISEKEDSLTILYDDIEEKKISMENQKRMLMDYLKLVYEQENMVKDTTADTTQISIAKLLLGDGSIGDMLVELRYLNILEKQGHEIFGRLEQLYDELKNDERMLSADRAKLAILNLRLNEEKHSLDIQKAAKSALLRQTNGEEAIYSQLLEESLVQQAELEEEINTLRDALAFIESERRRLGDDFDPADYDSLIGSEKTSVYEYINATKDDDTDFVMDWPVPFERGISAYFRDPSYVGVFGVRHNAIDIRVPQETEIRAPADGVVYKVKDNGMGYSYIMIAHKGGFMSIFGHVTDSFVEVGEKVYQGRTVGLSGGMPGTKGAGLMTTGPHLHFELLKGGKYVDPLYYLPLDDLPMEGLPEKYADPDFRLLHKVKRLTK